MEQQLKALRDVLVKAERVAALTGAGISAESGVPTFRGAWEIRRAPVLKLLETWT